MIVCWLLYVWLVMVFLMLLSSIEYAGNEGMGLLTLLTNIENDENERMMTKMMETEN